MVVTFQAGAPGRIHFMTIIFFELTCDSMVFVGGSAIRDSGRCLLCLARLDIRQAVIFSFNWRRGRFHERDASSDTLLSH